MILEGTQKLVRVERKQVREPTKMASTTISLPPSPVFTGENYELWVAKMKGYFIAYSLWEIVNDGAQPPPLPNNPIVA